MVAFDRFRFDASTGRLWAGADEVRLTPKAAAVLAVLVGRPGEPVRKEEIFTAAWPDTAVGDDALTTCILELRKALADDARQPRFIETRHRRGYRFIAPLNAAAAPISTGTAASAVPHAPEVTTVAVLPFADMSPGRDQQYLCDGLADELIGALTHVDGLRVAARTASFRFRDMGADVQAVGRQLGVAALLEGSVRKAESRLRVTVQLIDVATGYHRWSRRFDCALDDVFALQDEIAESVVRSLRGGVLSQREQHGLRRPHTGTDAYEHYLRGRQGLPRMTRGDLTESVRMFRRAIELDEAYAPAYAGLAMAHASLHEWFGALDEDRIAAEEASARGLALAPNLADTHVARGCALALSRRYVEAGAAFEAAIVLNPNLFEAHYYYARTCFASGDIERSAALFTAAARVRREDYQSPLLAGQALRMLGRLDEAGASRREGIARAERALVLNPADGRALSLGAFYLFEEGDRARAEEWSDRALAMDPDDMSALINGACLRARMGQKERALALLEQVMARGWGKRDWIEHDPDYDSLRDAPRVQALLERLK
jgi:adenylate cyclase